MKLAYLAPAFLIIAAGCHAQVPPASTSTVNLSWTAPAASGGWAGCTTAAPCTYAIYRATFATASACPASTNTAYTEVTNPAARPSGTTFTDATASGTVCYIGETVQGAANSGPSNTAGPATVAGVPLAPTLGTPVVAQTLQPASSKQLAQNAPMSLRIVKPGE